MTYIVEIEAVRLDSYPIEVQIIHEGEVLWKVLSIVESLSMIAVC